MSCFDVIFSDSLLMFEEQEYKGDHVLLWDDEPSIGGGLNDKVSSFIVLGQSSWTIYG